MKTRVHSIKKEILEEVRKNKRQFRKDFLNAKIIVDESQEPQDHNDLGKSEEIRVRFESTSS